MNCEAITKDQRQLGQAGDDVLGNPVGEILLFGVAAHVRKWQYSNRRPFGRCPVGLTSRNNRLCYLLGQMYAVDTDGTGNVFDRLLTHIVEFKPEFVLHLIMYNARDQDASGFG